jgi:hypothetical protein
MRKDDAGTRLMGMRMAKAVRRACDAREGPAQERGVLQKCIDWCGLAGGSV